MIFVILEKGILDILEHPNHDKYPNQRIIVLAIDSYVYLVPAMFNDEMKMNFDDYEDEILKAYENDELISSRSLDGEIAVAKKAAHAYFTKDTRINIRLSGADLEILKRLAAKEGLAYQSFISSVLHKYASGQTRFSP